MLISSPARDVDTPIVHIKYADNTYSLHQTKKAEHFFIPAVTKIDWIKIDRPKDVRVCEQRTPLNSASFGNCTSCIFEKGDNLYDFAEYRQKVEKETFDYFLKSSNPFVSRMSFMYPLNQFFRSKKRFLWPPSLQ